MTRAALSEKLLHSADEEAKANTGKREGKVSRCILPKPQASRAAPHVSPPTSLGSSCGRVPCLTWQARAARRWSMMREEAKSDWPTLRKQADSGFARASSNKERRRELKRQLMRAQARIDVLLELRHHHMWPPVKIVPAGRPPMEVSHGRAAATFESPRAAAPRSMPTDRRGG